NKSIVEPLIQLFPRAPLLKKGHRCMLVKDWWERFFAWHTVFSDDLKHELLNGRTGKLSNTFLDVFAPYTFGTEQFDAIDRMLWVDMNVWLPDDLLMKKDKMGMATSIEARVPFLDPRFVELGFQLPSTLKIRGLETKYILKKS